MGPKGVKNLQDRIQQDLDAGTTVAAEPATIDRKEINRSVRASLATPEQT